MGAAWGLQLEHSCIADVPLQDVDDMVSLPKDQFEKRAWSQSGLEEVAAYICKPCLFNSETEKLRRVGLNYPRKRRGETPTVLSASLNHGKCITCLHIYCGSHPQNFGVNVSLNTGLPWQISVDAAEVPEEEEVQLWWKLLEPPGIWLTRPKHLLFSVLRSLGRSWLPSSHDKSYGFPFSRNGLGYVGIKYFIVTRQSLYSYSISCS